MAREGTTINSVSQETSGRARSVLVFDSGLGGLTVLREIARVRADLELSLVADDAAFPYGRLDDKALVDRVVAVLDRYIEVLQPELVVIACNTASTLALPVLRSKFSIPFVGTVPAIKPACAQSKSKRISVLATPGTVRRDYTRDLIAKFAGDCHVTLVGGDMLASFAEATLRGEPVDDSEIRREIAPCFLDEGGSRTDTVVLACTHYPLILDHLQKLAPWPVTWLDPAPAIARRASDLLGEAGSTGGAGHAYFTSGKAPTAALEQALAQFGLLTGEPSREPHVV